MSRAEYAAIPAINWSTLKEMAVSPRFYRWRLAHPAKSKPAYRLGNAAHCAVFEPEKFDGRYVVLDTDTIGELAPARNTKAGKAIIEAHPEWAALSSDDYKAAAVRAEYPDKELITDTERDDALAMRESVYAHPVARELLRGGLAEETVTWTDERTGLACKGRLDYLRPDLVLDAKSTRDPSPRQFERAAAAYGYFGQCLFYHDGAVAARRIDGQEHPVIIAIRNCDDFDVAVYRIDSQAMEAGRATYRAYLDKLAQCTAADYWPGVAPELRLLGCPPWATPEIESTSEEGF